MTILYVCVYFARIFSVGYTIFLFGENGLSHQRRDPQHDAYEKNLSYFDFQTENIIKR